MIAEGRAHVFGDNVTTDEIMPVHKAAATAAELAAYAMVGCDPDFPKKVKAGDVIVAGENFGAGSSRETAPVGLKGAGLGAIVAKSFARTFYRNCINQGLPILVCPEAVAACRPGDSVRIELETGRVEVAGRAFQAEAFPEFLLTIIRHGGNVGYARAVLAERARGAGA